MKYLTIVLLSFLFFNFTENDTQNNSGKIPSVDLKTLDGQTINTSAFDNEGKPIVISFWATYCKPCIKELDAIAELYDEWEEETGVKIIAINIDDARSFSKIGPLVNSKDWTYDIYLDQNSDFKRAMNVGTIPHVFLLDGNLEIVSQHNTYTEGSEIDFYEEIKALVEENSNEE